VQIGPVTLRCRDSGGDGLPVLLTHGIGGSLELWNRQFDAPLPGLRLLAWDMPGHGLSSAAPGDTDLAAIARLAWQLLDALGVPTALLVGNSLGGAVSLRMAGQAPGRVSGLLLAAAATLGRETLMPFRLMTLPGLGEAMNQPGPAGVRRQVQAIVQRPDAVTPEVLAAIERNVARPGASAHFLALLRSITSLGGQKAAVWQHSHQLLRAVRAPVVLLHGAQDRVLPPAHSRQAATLVPGAELVLWPDCGHTPQLEQPEDFNRLLARLAARVSQGALAEAPQG